MRRFNLVNGEMIESETGEYVLHSEVVDIDNIAANTLLTQLDGIREQIAEWQTL